ncbi:MAG: hypothetical protein HPY74_06445 [Firmicutes bacterium]|nr:hypothetical protein [Bacillota bacterium]
MVTKFLKRKLVLKESNDYFHDIPMELEYYLLESNIDYKSELAGKKVYGISIVKKINDTCFEENSVLNFSCCVNETSRVVDKLADNTVTPVGLKPILDDLL